MFRDRPLIALYARSVGWGFALATAFTAALLWLDVAHLRHLVMAVDGGTLALFLLWFFNGLVFAGAQTAVAVLLMAEDDGTPPHRPNGEAVPVPVRSGQSHSPRTIWR